jgi:hypothetical protein
MERLPVVESCESLRLIGIAARSDPLKAARGATAPAACRN